jgi:DhnA family fructose-bisphosphate aldolase class Ia
MTKPRLNRFFHSCSGRCLAVGVDHGLFNEYAFLQGLEKMDAMMDTLVRSSPDALQLAPGQARRLQTLKGKEKPSLLLRVDVANLYHGILPTHFFSHLAEGAVELALRLDATAVIASLVRVPNHAEVHEQCLKNILRLQADCERWEMPMVVEPLVLQTNEDAGGFVVDGDVEKILPLVRQAVELGADVVKVDPTDNLRDYPRVIEIAGIPVLVRSGGKGTDESILARTEEAIRGGAVGVVYGRNIFQHPRPSAMIKALATIIHQGSTAAAAAKLLRDGAEPTSCG